MLSKLQLPLAPDHSVGMDTPAADSNSELIYTSNTPREQFAPRQSPHPGWDIQVVLSQQLCAEYAGDLALYRSLRLINPSPYMASLQ